MKILLVNDYIVPFGWAEKVVQNIFWYLETSDHEVELFGHTTSQRPSLLGRFSLLIKYTHKLTNFKPDIVHLHRFQWIFGVWIFVVSKIFSRAKIIWHVHDFSISCYWMGVKNTWEVCDWWVRHGECVRHVTRGWLLDVFYDIIKFFRWVCRRFIIKNTADWVVSLSSYLDKTNQRTFWYDKKYLLLPNYIEQNNTYALKENWNNILFVWRLEKEKWLEVLIRSIDILAKEWKSHKDITLDIVWDWSLRSKLEDMVITMWLDSNILFHGRVEYSKISEYYSNARMLVVPSVRYENNPLVVLEWMSAHLPVIATDIWWLKDMIQHGHSGYLFSLWNYWELAMYIWKLLENKHNALQIWNTWFEILNKLYSKDSYYKKIEKFYQEI